MQHVQIWECFKNHHLFDKKIPYRYACVIPFSQLIRMLLSQMLVHMIIFAKINPPLRTKAWALPFQLWIALVWRINLWKKINVIDIWKTHISHQKNVSTHTLSFLRTTYLDFNSLTSLEMVIVTFMWLNVELTNWSFSSPQPFYCRSPVPNIVNTAGLFGQR